MTGRQMLVVVELVVEVETEVVEVEVLCVVTVELVAVVVLEVFDGVDEVDVVEVVVLGVVVWVVVVVEEGGLLLAELEAADVEGVTVTVCNMVVVDTKVAVTVDAVADEEGPV